MAFCLSHTGFEIPVTAIHLFSPNVGNIEAFAGPAADNDWHDAPFWMLNTFRFHDDGEDANRSYARRMREILAGVGASVVMSAPVAHTVMGERAFQAAAIVRYPSPAAFYTMATSDALAEASADRVQAFADQYLIPVSTRWMPGFDLEKPVNPRANIREWNVDALAACPDHAFIGNHHTQMTLAAASALLDDPGFGHNSPVYMLNLLQYAGAAGKAKHDAYIAGGNNLTGGSLGRQFGLRVIYSAQKTGPTLIGDGRWHSVGIASYPSLHHFFSMGADPQYIDLHAGRRDGLSRTYIIAMQPTLLQV